MAAGPPGSGTWLRSYVRRFGSPLAIAAWGVLTGIGLGEWCPARVGWGVAAVGCMVVSWRSASTSRWQLYFLALTTLACIHAVAEYDPLRTSLERQHKPLPATVTGLVDEAPVVDASGRNWRFPLQLEMVAGEPYPHAKVLVRMENVRPPGYGDRVTLQGHLQMPEPPRNPGEFDWAAYLHRTGFSGECVVEHASQVRLLERTGGSFLIRQAMAARAWIGQAVTQDLEADPIIAATVRTMVLGTQETTPQDVQDAFIESGTMHVFAVSGLHVALFGIVLMQLLGLFRCPLLPRTLVTILLMLFYVYITGLRPSAWRAAFMASIILVGPLMQRQGHLYTSLSFALLCLLGLDSELLFQPGFQLSFGVVFMLAVMSRPVLTWLSPWFLPDPFIPRELLSPGQLRWATVKKIGIESVVVSFCATLGSAPLMLHHFGLLSPVGVFANLLLVPLSSGILYVACLSLLSSGARLWALVAWSNNANWLLATLSIASAKFFASVPYGHLRINPARWFDDATARLTLLAFPKGGGATHLDLREAQWMLDTGPHGGFLRVQRPYLLGYPLTELNGLILSHHDADHVGAASLFQQTFHPQETITASDYSRWQMSHLLRPQANATLLYPPPERAKGTADDLCLVVRFEIDGWRFLVTSDAGFLAEKWLLEHSVDVHADVLIKGWHENDFSGLPEFINAVAPRCIVVQPVRSLADRQAIRTWTTRLAGKHIPILNQADTGAVEIELHPDGLHLRGYFDKSELLLPKQGQLGLGNRREK